MAKTTEDLLSASRSPSSAPDTSGKRPGVRRLNNIPIYIVGAIIIGFAVIIALVSISKGNQASEDAEQNATGDARSMADSLFSELPGEGGLITPKASAPELPELPMEMASAPMLSASAPLSLPEAPPMPGGMAEIDQEADQIRQTKAQMFQEALRAPTRVNSVASASPGSSGMYSGSVGEPQTRSEMLARIAEVQQRAANAGNTPDVAAVYSQQLAALGQGGAATPAAANTAPTLSTPPTPGLAAEAGANKWQLNSQVIPPNTYMIRTGSVIPATLISGINSDLPGMVQAQISQNVYDTATGRHLLLPQGSRLIGSYESGVEFGKRRLFVAWNRIVFPDGKAIDIGAMPGTSGSGYSGFRDQVNNHYARIWGNALMLSIVGAAISYSADRNSENNESTVRGTLSESLGQTFGQAVTQSIQKNMNISPTLEIRPGYRFNVIITKDIDFSKPYRSFDY